MPRVDINVQPVHMTVTFEQLVQMRAAMQTQINRLSERIASNACTKDERERLTHKCALLSDALKAIPDPAEYVPF